MAVIYGETQTQPVSIAWNNILYIKISKSTGKISEVLKINPCECDHLDACTFLRKFKYEIKTSSCFHIVCEEYDDK